MLQQLILVLR